MCHTCDGNISRKSKKEKKLHKVGKKCPENDDKKKKLPKCPKPKRSQPKPPKCLTRIERIMLRIQPPIAARERYLHPEHVNCFLEESERIYINKPKCRPCPPKRPKVCVEGTKKKKSIKPDENANGGNDQDDKMKNEKDNDVESGAMEQKDDGANITAAEDKDMLERKEAEGRARTSKSRKNRRRKKRKEVVEEDSESEMSICSNDSEVCLVGLALTVEDKKKIEENRRRVHPPPDNEENSTKSNKNAEELSIPEGENNQ